MGDYYTNVAEIMTENRHEFVQYETVDEVRFICGHCGASRVANLVNIKLWKGGCSDCFHRRTTFINSARETEEIVRKRGHEFVQYESAAKVVYKCGNCGLFSSSTKNSLKCAATMSCKACRFSKSPQYQDKIKRILEKHGLKLAAPCRSMHKICCVCTCGELVTAPLCVLKRGCTHESRRV